MNPVAVGAGALLVGGGLYLLNRAPRVQGADGQSTADFTLSQLGEATKYAVAVPDTQPKGKDRLALFGGWEGYIAELYRRFHQRRTVLNSIWTVPALQAATRAAAATVGLADDGARVLWAITRHESGAKPVGIYNDDVGDSIAANSSAYGITQVTGGTFDDLADACPWYHHDLWHPGLALLTAGTLLRRLFDSHQGNLLAVLTAYAGTQDGGQRLLAYVEGHGGELAGLGGSLAGFEFRSSHVGILALPPGK